MTGDSCTDGVDRCWDHEDCPCGDCGGELQHQDRFNVMCLACGAVFTHWKDNDHHRLLTESNETVAKKARMVPDGGNRVVSTGTEQEDNSE